MRHLPFLILLSLVIACGNMEPPSNNQSDNFQEVSKFKDSIQGNKFLDVKGISANDSFILYRLFSGITILADSLGTPLYIDENFSSNSWNGIVVHKTAQAPKILVDSFPRPPGYYQDKYQFIETYWNENASKFVI